MKSTMIKSFAVTTTFIIAIASNLACNGSSKNAANGNSGIVGEGSNDANQDSPGQPGNPATELDFAQIVASMNWEVFAFNNDSGRVYSGYNAETEFLVAVGVIVESLFDDIDQYSYDDLDEIFSSDEYLLALDEQLSNIAFNIDPDFFELIEEESFSEGKVYYLATRSAGETTINIAIGGQSLSLVAEITAYSDTQIEAGQERYNNAVAGEAPSPSCAACHMSASGVDHSPFYMAQFSDAGILSTIETGINSDDDYETSVPHQMSFANDDQRNGIVAYLRGLDPR